MSSISINKKLNIAFSIDIDDGKKIWIHSVPISKEIFEQNYLLLAKAMSNLYINGIGPALAPRIAALVLRDTAKEMNETTDISFNLFQEIYRITNVLMETETGWTLIPFHEVKNKKMLDESILSEVENAVVYFMLASSIHLKSELRMAYQGLIGIWNAQITSLNVTGFLASLKTLTTEENTGEKPSPPKALDVKASSIPS